MKFKIKTMLFLAFILHSCGNENSPETSSLELWGSNKWDSNDITVCWEDMSPEFEKGRQITRKAVEETWMKYSKVKFKHWGKCENPTFFDDQLRITIKDSQPMTLGLGKSLKREKERVFLNFTYNIFQCQRAKEECIRIAAVHEFGHILGFAHEHNRASERPITCKDEVIGTQGEEKLTRYDDYSIMNYCNPKWMNHGELSPLDIAGLQKWYGKP